MLSTGRTLIGGLVGGLILFVVGFIFWATPIGQLAYKTAPDAQGAAVQLALAQNLSPTGTGTYTIPAPHSQQGGVLYSQGPIATVHFNTSGYSPDDMTMILPGLVLALISGVLLAMGLSVLAATRSFGERARLVLFVSVAITMWTILGQPIFNHYGWGYWIYSFVAETTALVLAGLVVARWFLPHPQSSPADAPTDV